MQYKVLHESIIVILGTSRENRRRELVFYSAPTGFVCCGLKDTEIGSIYSCWQSSGFDLNSCVDSLSFTGKGDWGDRRFCTCCHGGILVNMTRRQLDVQVWSTGKRSEWNHCTKSSHMFTWICFYFSIRFQQMEGVFFPLISTIIILNR